MKTVYPDENNVVLNENSVERKPCINRESKCDELTIKLYSCHDINMKFLSVVSPPSIYKLPACPVWNGCLFPTCNGSEGQPYVWKIPLFKLYEKFYITIKDDFFVSYDCKHNLGLS